MSDISLKFHRITTFNKPTDRYLSCEKHSTEENNANTSSGLFSLIEIQSPLPSIVPIGKTIINTCVREYYRSKEETVSVKFETALKKVNETLTHSTQSGITEWIGKINAVLLLIHNEEIHIASVGSPIAYLLRDDKFINLLEDQSLTDKDTHPLHTFANLTSGELKIGDVLFISNPQLMDIIDKKDLKNIIELNTLEDAILTLTNEIRQTPHHPNLMLVEVYESDEDIKSQSSEVPETIFLDRINDPLFARTKLLLKRKLSPQITIAGTTVTGAADSMITLIKKSSPPIKYYSKRTLSIINNSGIKLLSITKKFPNSRKSRQNFDGIIESPQPLEKSLHINHYGKKSISFIFKKIYHFISSSFNQFLQQINRLIIHPKERYRLWRISFIILAITLIASIAIKTRHIDLNKNPIKTTTANELQVQLSKINNLNNDDAITSLSQIIKSSSGDKNLKNINNEAKNKLALLTNTHNLTSPANSYNIPNNSRFVFIINKVIFLISTTGEIFQLNQSTGSSNLVASLPKNDNQLVSTNLVQGKIFLFTHQHSLYQYLPDQQILKTVPIRSASAWPSAQYFSSYDSNLYFLDPSQGKIWKYLLYSGRYSTPIDYSQDQENYLKNSQSISVADSLYILTKKNQFQNISKNDSATIVPSNFPTSAQKIKQPIKLFYRSSNETLNILEKGKIISLSTDGIYKEEIVLPPDYSAQDVVFSKSNLWILTDNSLQQYPLSNQ